jgi:hypothetical protein
MNFEKPDNEKLIGNPQEDYSRLATTYYHRLGPVGIVMEKFNWQGQNFQGPENTYHADARMPASLIGLAASPMGVALPADQLVALWSEPPIATIGLGTGTMASYGRPFQHVHFYEIDSHVRKLSLPSAGRKQYFTYLTDAKARGCEVQVLMGDARLRMAEPYGPYDEEKEKRGKGIGGGPDNFYHMMVVDAFSSDAIPVHLLTVEAFELYFSKLSEEGVLCVHTSNRYVDLPKVVADVASYGIRKDPKDPNSPRESLAYLRGHDVAPGHDARGASISERGHYTSEWVMVARKAAYLSHLKEPPGYREKFGNRSFEEYWTIPRATLQHVWTNDFSNLWKVLK